MTSCQLCGAALQELTGYGALPRVASDCRPWPPGGALAACSACGTVQKVADGAWRAEAQRVYESYAVYSQSQGAEQAVFVDGQGALTRSARLVSQLAGVLDLPRHGKLLDVGCGNGAFLTAFGARFGGWRLSGAELDERNLAALETVQRFERLYCGPLPSIDVEARFDCVSFIHALEHFEDPVGVLRGVCERLLAPGGGLVVEVPCSPENPFDLLVVDHLLHFSPLSLRRALSAAGVTERLVTTEFIPKEITALGAYLPRQSIAPPGRDTGEPAHARRQLSWLARVVEHAQDLSRDAGALGIFGTSIAGSWLQGALGGGADFFVDEDPNRAGRSHLERPILAPEAVPPGALVYVPLAPMEVAERVARRYDGREGRRYRCPPPLEA